MLVAAGAEVDDEVLLPKPENRLGAVVAVDVVLFPPRPENKLGVVVDVGAGAVEPGAALVARFANNGGPEEPGVAAEVVGGFPNIDGLAG